jgi:predicted nucleotidyltransferase
MQAVISAELLRDERLARLLEDVVQTHQPLAVYLFGSRAEGNACPTSDYDLLVVLADDATDDDLDVGRAYGSVLRTHVPGDVIPTTRGLFIACAGEPSTLEGAVHERGRLIYGAL